MKTEDLVLMRVGTNMEEATIVRWHKKLGEAFKAGEPLYEIETEKVTFEVEAAFDGTLHEINVPEGEVGSVGQVIGTALVAA